jgi:hypothetical protein
VASVPLDFAGPFAYLSVVRSVTAVRLSDAKYMSKTDATWSAVSNKVLSYPWRTVLDILRHPRNVLAASRKAQSAGICMIWKLLGQ